MSQITAIYAGLAAMVVQADGADVPVRNLADLPNASDTARLPIRLLLPFGTVIQGQAARGASFDLMAIDDMSNVRWRIDDVMLYKRVGEGRGLSSAAAGLVTYVANYARAIRLTREPAPQSRVVSLEFVVGPVEWPENSDSWFNAVVARVEVEETFRYA